MLGRVALLRMACTHVAGTAMSSSVRMACGAARVRIAVVGDVHGQWDDGDAQALRALQPPVDLVLFVGDFGDEDVETVSAVARSDLPGERVSIFGNHDAWFSLDPRKRRPKKSARRSGTTALDRQRELLLDCNLEYAKREFPNLGVSVVGGRPYSIGGPIWPGFYVEQYGLTSHIESGDKIGRIAARSDSDVVVFLAHNGPHGLGAQPGDPCGRDWVHKAGKYKGSTGGDWGDHDLTAAIKMARASGKSIPLVTFGHMHRRLIGGGVRKMLHVDKSTGTVYLNVAQVPRWRGSGVQPLAYDASAPEGHNERRGPQGLTSDQGDKEHWFAIVEMNGDPVRVERVTGCWVNVHGSVAEEELWFERSGGGDVDIAASFLADAHRGAN